MEHNVPQLVVVCVSAHGQRAVDFAGAKHTIASPQFLRHHLRQPLAADPVLFLPGPEAQRIRLRRCQRLRVEPNRLRAIRDTAVHSAAAENLIHAHVLFHAAPAKRSQRSRKSMEIGSAVGVRARLPARRYAAGQRNNFAQMHQFGHGDRRAAVGVDHFAHHFCVCGVWQPGDSLSHGVHGAVFGFRQLVPSMFQCHFCRPSRHPIGVSVGVHSKFPVKIAAIDETVAQNVVHVLDRCHRQLNAHTDPNLYVSIRRIRRYLEPIRWIQSRNVCFSPLIRTFFSYRKMQGEHFPVIPDNKPLACIGTKRENCCSNCATSRFWW